MNTAPVLESPASVEVLLFDIPEVDASGPMGTTASQCCATLGFTFTSIDVWANPEAVLTHRVLVGPTIVLLSGGEEASRLVGPRSCRRVERFLASALPVPEPARAVA